MKITSLHITDFGKFNNVNPIKDYDSNMVLIYGNNEAGKTTLFNLMKCMLYGFSPAKNELHPYSSWLNERIEFSAKLVSREGEVEVYRRLLSSPKGQLKQGDQITEIKNTPLPFVSHVSTDIFERIYALRVEDLIELEGKAWNEVQDKLLANFSNQLIRNTRDVISEINEEANSISRENGRGNYLLKQLEDELKRLKKERAEALGRQQQLRSYDERLVEVHEEVKRLQEGKINLKQLLRRAKELLPLKNLLKELQDIEEGFLHKDLFNQLSEELLKEREVAIEKINKLNTEIEEKTKLIAYKTSKIYSLSEEEEKMIENKTNINQHIKNMGKIQSLEEMVNRLENEKEKIEDKLNYEGSKLFNERMNESLLENLEALNISEVRVRIEAHKKAIKQVENSLSKQQGMGEEATIGKPIAFVAASILGGIGFIMGLLLNIGVLTLIGGAIGFFGVAGIISSHVLKKQLTSQKTNIGNNKEAEAELKRLMEEEKAREAELIQLFSNIPIPSIVITNIDEILLSSLIKLKDDYYQYKETKTQLHSKRQQLQSEISILIEFISAFNSFPRKEESIYLMKEVLEELEKKQVTNIAMEQEVQQLTLEKEGIEKALQQNMEGLKTIDEKLTLLGEGDLEKGIEVFILNKKLLERKKIKDEQLLQWNNVSQLKDEIIELEKEENDCLNNINVSEVEERLEEIENGIIQLKEEKKEIEIRSQQLMEANTIDEIESQLTIIEDKYKEACIRRDQLAILAEVIRISDEKFREENQPDVLKNASRYFNFITEGRYTGIYIEEAEKGSLLRVKEKDSATTQKVSETFSKGTLNQLYLSLRLSLMDHLDRDKNQLPIFFDELFINWDEERLSNNLLLLREICKNRQVFFFTCHDWLATKIEEAFDVSRINLNEQ